MTPECGPGWQRIIDPLIEMCRIKGMRIEQIKEKFGGLRFYVDSADPELDEAIARALRESFTVCETCGAPGCLRNELGWLTTRCDEHFFEDRLRRQQEHRQNEL